MLDPVKVFLGYRPGLEVTVFFWKMICDSHASFRFAVTRDTLASGFFPLPGVQRVSPPSHQRGHHSQAGCACAQRAMPGAQAKNARFIGR